MFIDNVLRELRPRYDEVVRVCKESGHAHGHDVTEEFAMQRDATLTQYKKRLEELLRIEKIDQRTPKWYEARQNLITASNFAQALDKAKFGTQKEFLIKKCCPQHSKNGEIDIWCPPLKWGTMYEPVAIKIYEMRNKVKLHELGLLKHETLEYFGASPDGITEDGIMLEIKCPFRRKIIDNEVPLQYYFQVQGQLDVCKLEECDYLECKLSETIVDRDGDMYMMLLLLPQDEERGIVLERVVNGEPVYMYSPVSLTNKTDNDIKVLKEWYDQHIDLYPSQIAHLWHLQLYSVQRIHKDREFLEENFKELDKIKDLVNVYKLDNRLAEKELNL